MRKEKEYVEEKKMEQERKLAVKLELEREEEKLREEKALKNVLKEQITELKHRESEVCLVNFFKAMKITSAVVYDICNY